MLRVKSLLLVATIYGTVTGTGFKTSHLAHNDMKQAGNLVKIKKIKNKQEHNQTKKNKNKKRKLSNQKKKKKIRIENDQIILKNQKLSKYDKKYTIMENDQIMKKINKKLLN